MINETKEDGILITLRNLRALNGESEVAVSLELASGGHSESRTLVISMTQYCEIKPERGLISEEKFEAIERAARIWAAVRCGENLLSYGANTEAMLARKIMRHGFTREEAVEASRMLREDGLINENEDIRREVERCLAKHWGERRIKSQLWTRGYTKEALDSLPGLLDEIDFPEICAGWIDRYYGGVPKSEEEVRRMTASLYRYGYTLDQIREGIRISRHRK